MDTVASCCEFQGIIYLILMAENKEFVRRMDKVDFHRVKKLESAERAREIPNSAGELRADSSIVLPDECPGM